MPRYAESSQTLSRQGAGRVCYYELVEEGMVESFQAHKGVVTGLALHPKGECLLTASTDGAIKVWQ